jgi:hypothetical protein
MSIEPQRSAKALSVLFLCTQNSAKSIDAVKDQRSKLITTRAIVLARCARRCPATRRR